MVRVEDRKKHGRATDRGHRSFLLSSTSACVHDIKHGEVRLSTTLFHRFIDQHQTMSTFFVLLFVFVGLASAGFKAQREFEIKQGSLLNNGRSYTITETSELAGKENPKRYTVENDLISLGKKIVLLENGQPLYHIKHKLGHVYQKWNVYNALTDETIGSLKHRPSVIHDSYKLKSSKFGNYRVSGNIGGRKFDIKKNGQKVAEIEKKRFHLHDTYTVKVAANEDTAIVLLLAIGIDEIRQH